MPRERWDAILERKQSDRPPLDYWATDEVTTKLMKYLKVDTLRALYEKLEIDVPFKVEPQYTGPPLSPDEDVFGCKFRDVDYGTGSYRECIYHPLADYKSVEEIEKNYSWPVLTGGSSKMEGVVDLAEEIFHVPVRLGLPQYVSGLSDVVSNPIHATGVGLLLFGYQHRDVALMSPLCGEAHEVLQPSLFQQSMSISSPSAGCSSQRYALHFYLRKGRRD